MESDTQELQIDTTEGLQAFWSYVNDVYAELQTTPISDDANERVEDIYDALKRLIEDNLETKARGNHVSEEDASLIQAGYDELIEILEQPKEVAATEPAPTKSSNHLPTATPREEVAESLVSSRPLSSNTSSAILDRPFTESARSESDSDLPQDSAGVVLRQEAVRISDRAKTLLVTYTNLSNQTTSAEVKAVADHYYAQLKVSAKRSLVTLEQLTSKLKQSNPLLSDLVKEHYEDILQEIDENLTQLETGLSAVLLSPQDRPTEIKTTTSPKISRATLGIRDETHKEGTVPILIAPPVQKKLIAPIKKDSTRAIFNDPQKPASPKFEQTVTSPLTRHLESVMSIPRYRSFITNTIGSSVQAEAMIRREIQQIEAPSKFEALFGFSYASVFYNLLVTMTAKDISDFDSQPRDSIRAILTEKNIKYEMYLDWIDLLVPILELTRAHANVPFAELFIRAHIESLIREATHTTQ